MLACRGAVVGRDENARRQNIFETRFHSDGNEMLRADLSGKLDTLIQLFH